jgi:hypothetical protein
MASLVGIPANLRTVLAAHRSFQFMNWRHRLRSSDDCQIDCRMVLAAKAFHFEVPITSIECVCHHGRGLGGPLQTKHSVVPGFAG